MVRINFSHGNLAQHLALFQAVRDTAASLTKEVAILADIQGPKIRISSFAAGAVELVRGQEFTLDANIADKEGDITAVGIDYKDLYKDVTAGATLLLGDGEISLNVKKIIGKKVVCIVAVEGRLSDHKGINLYGGGLSASAITAKDITDINTAVTAGADYIALSFVRTAADIIQAREIISSHGASCAIVAKIERAEAVTNIESIADATDAIMVARGDLAVEIGAAEVPGVQKNIIKIAKSRAKPVIIATQMMESMITQRVPTRAEVSDVANAVLDGADAVMLSAETAVGSYPCEVVAAVANICCSAEKHHSASSIELLDKLLASTDEAIAVASMFLANKLDIKAVIALTESGKTPLWMSRIRSGTPIYGLSRNVAARRKMMLYRDVYPIDYDVTASLHGDVNYNAVALLEKLELISSGDKVFLTKGDYMGGCAGTNALKILEVGRVRKIGKCK